MLRKKEAWLHKMSKDLKKAVSEILVKWNMPTRQVAINEIVALLESPLQKESCDVCKPRKGSGVTSGICYCKVRNEVKDEIRKFIKG